MRNVALGNCAAIVLIRSIVVPKETMKALVKSRAASRSVAGRCAEPEPGINDVKKFAFCAPAFAAPLQSTTGTMGAITITCRWLLGTNLRRSRRWDRTWRIFVRRFVSGGRACGLRAMPELPRGAAPLRTHAGRGSEPRRRVSEYVVLPMMNVWRHTHPIPPESAQSLIRSERGHMALSFPVLGEVSRNRSGPIGIMAAVVARFAGARHVLSRT